MIYVTIIICTLLIVVGFLGWKYLSRDFAIEAAQDTQLDDISIIAGKLLDKYNVWDAADDKDKYSCQPNHKEVMDVIYDIHTISTRGYDFDNK